MEYIFLSIIDLDLSQRERGFKNYWQEESKFNTGVNFIKNK